MGKVKAATWNAGGGEGPTGPTPKQAEDLLTRIRELECDFVLLQEAQDEEVRRILHDLDYRYFYTRPETLVAWLPEHTWDCLAQHDEVLNPHTPFFRPGSTVPVHLHMPRAVVCNGEGVSMNLGTYHTPSDLQNANPPELRLAATRESMGTMGDLAKESKCYATLFGGDDNVDETKGFGPWDFMKFRATGLRIIRAPKPTLGPVRKVDDFRVKNLKRDGDGRVLDGPTDHNAYVQSFLLPV